MIPKFVFKSWLGVVAAASLLQVFAATSAFAWGGGHGGGGWGGGHGGGGWNGGPQQTVYVQCSSEHGQPAQCYTGLARVFNVYVAQPQSNAPCNPGQSFGVNGNMIWVSYGCRAIFAVVGQGNYNPPPPPPPPPPQYNLPNGSYLQSCQGCNVNYNNVLSCQCKDIHSNWQFTQLYLNQCTQPPVVHNNNGNLVCG